MFDGSDNRSGLLARMVADPVRLRRQARIALGCLVVVVVVARLASGNLPSLLTALAWVCAPFVAFALGFGDAFFIRHGRGQRRTLLLMTVAWTVALLSCVALAGAANRVEGAGGRWLEAAMHGLLYLAIVVGLAGLIGLGIGRGEEYVSRGIDRMSDEEW